MVKLKKSVRGYGLHKMATQDKKYSTQDLFWILGQALILLQDKTIKIHESDRYNEEAEEVTKRVGLVDYIARAVADELVEHFGETKEDVKKAIEDTKMDFDEIAHPDDQKCVGIYNDIR